MRIPGCDDVDRDISSVSYKDKMFVFYKKRGSLDVYRHVFDLNGWVGEQVEGVQTVEGLASIVH
jgi:hypothetical protein